MARRSYQFFNLSFLDVISGALGAVLFLFIIVDKGGGQAVPPPAGGQYPKVYLSLDTARQQFHGFMPDSIAARRPGESVLVVVKAVEPAPGQPQPAPCPPAPPCDCDGRSPRCPRPEDHRRVCTNPEDHRQPHCPDPAHHQRAACPDAAAHRTPRCPDPACHRQVEPRASRPSDPIGLPYKLGFLLEAANFKEEIDIQVCRDGACINGFRKTGEGMRWLDLRRGGLAKKARTGGELILMEEKLIPGIYSIYARLDCRSTASTTVTAFASIKDGAEVTGQEQFIANIPCGNDWLFVGKVEVDASGKLFRKL
ncbi:MAG: hypothetical protein J5I98_09865 [Phaeodactylibacter sp.]|nr:hypothetical protein [Phaeodactylibacter sp.]